MIDLGQPSASYELELPYGLRVTVRPLSTAGMAAAQAAARRAVDAIQRQARERMDAGLALDGLPALSDEGERDGFYQAQLIRELAVRHVTGWTGVELEGGPAPPTPDNIAAVMQLYPVGERFLQEFTLRQVLLNAAKNGVWTPPALQARSLIVRHEPGSAAAMYPAFDAAPWPLASMRSAVGSRLSGRARGSAFFSGSANPGLTGHAIASKNPFAARGNCRSEVRCCGRSLVKLR